MLLLMLGYFCLVLQIQQLEEHLEKSKEELSQLKSDLQENVELVSFLSLDWSLGHVSVSLHKQLA